MWQKSDQNLELDSSGSTTSNDSTISSKPTPKSMKCLQSLSKVHPTENIIETQRNSDRNKIQSALFTADLRHCQTNDPSSTASLMEHESRRNFFLQSCVPFVLAGFGLIGAGILLGRASTWTFFTEMPEVLILVPPLLGLKGNLEMTLASRLSTMANLGQLDLARQQLTALYSNVALVQAQAIVVSLVASVLAVGGNWIDAGDLHYQVDFSRAFCLVFSVTLTVSIASFFMSSMMVILAILSRRFGLNPDNITAPIAAAMGDITSLGLLVLIGTWIYTIRDLYLDILLIIFLLLLLSALFWMWVAAQVPHTRKVLKYGWFAVLAAMMISSMGGYVLRHTMNYYPSMGLFQPVINGVGGNLVAVQASKISTYLHQHAKKGILPANKLITYANPLRAFACKEHESRNAVVLLVMSVPGHLLFTTLMRFSGELPDQSLSLSFLALYICAAFLQVAILLYCCQLLCRILWRLRWDPDINAIPPLTGLGDLLGTCFLAMAFIIHLRLFPEYGLEEGEQIHSTLVAGLNATTTTIKAGLNATTATAFVEHLTVSI